MEYLPSPKRKETKKLYDTRDRERSDDSAEGFPFPRVQVVTHQSKLYHSGAIEERVEQHLRVILGLAQETPEPNETVAGNRRGRKGESNQEEEKEERNETPEQEELDPNTPHFYLRVVDDTVQVLLQFSLSTFRAHMFIHNYPDKC